MEIFTLFDDIKYFKIEFKKNVDSSVLMDVKNIIENAFDMSIVTQIRKIDIKESEISMDCEHSLTHAELNINTKNQIGLLAYVMSVLDELDINIVSAKIHSTKHKVRDSFLMSKQNNICNNVEKIYKLLIK
jgi:[protein-PII] uridylyltransferase